MAVSVGYKRKQKRKTTMSGKIVNFKTKGDTDVKNDDLSIEGARVKRTKEAKWNDFELIGATNKEEGEHVSSAESDPIKLEAALERIRKSRFIGTSVLSALNSAA